MLLLFIKFIADFFYSNYDLEFTSCAVDSSSYSCGHGFSDIVKALEPNFNKILNWFRQSGLIANLVTSHVLTSRYEKRSQNIHDSVIISSYSEELLCILMESELTYVHYTWLDFLTL